MAKCFKHYQIKGGLLQYFSLCEDILFILHLCSKYADFTNMIFQNGKHFCSGLGYYKICS